MDAAATTTTIIITRARAIFGQKKEADRANAIILQHCLPGQGQSSIVVSNPIVDIVEGRNAIVMSAMRVKKKKVDKTGDRPSQTRHNMSRQGKLLRRAKLYCVITLICWCLSFQIKTNT